MGLFDLCLHRLPLAFPDPELPDEAAPRPPAELARRAGEEVPQALEPAAERPELVSLATRKSRVLFETI
jgi:hypothetical protein